MRQHQAPEREQKTRRKILLLLKKHGSIRVQDISQRLGLTEMAIRKHLYALQEERFIEAAVQRQPIGRPIHVYRLTLSAEALFPNQYDALAADLLDEMNEMFGESVIRELFERRQEKLEQKHRAAMSGGSLEQRVAGLAAIQNREGYMVTVDKLDDGSFLFEEANCPIARIACRYRQACQCELSLFQEVLDAQVERLECMADGDVKCCYRIAEKPTDS
ncbi:metalloregulator ArsR/SmtB family transcription factor [Paenibacillus thiaminolyticus]|jgi:predicted ArsR family transcriptional regulator|uniref:Transcriptional regulator n=1 Tax=Paenibacillus thiaminolyticus TaxID=49283 RepID=A0A3A3GCP4_PANTH|nr:metalloregulator ArsR/SmtB family transcription factor [Paenibacillus thiaminolyticus]RJG19129.1 transcriptional regulator [Paenibacillus thiaminolyticus]